MNKENNIQNITADACTGCGVCAAACPHDCINLAWDENGYLKARMSSEAICKSCGKCLNVCYINLQATRLPQRASQVFVGSNRDVLIRYGSSSGGLASALAATALEQGYEIIGAELMIESSTAYVQHVCIDNVQDLARIRGSKYVPSNTKEAFGCIRENPAKKYMVFGTPCQIASLRMQYGDSDRLILVDFRCSGPSSQFMLDKHVHSLNRRNQAGIQSINMHDKSKNWFVYGFRAVYKNNSAYYKDKLSDDFLLGFLNNVRQKACVNCRELKNASYADIRIEDAWHELPMISREDYKKGLTKISLFSKVGKELFSSTKDRISCFELETASLPQTFQSVIFDKSFFSLLRNDALSLEQINKEYRKTLRLSKRIRIKLESHLQYSYALHKFLYRIVCIIRNCACRKLGK